MIEEGELKEGDEIIELLKVLEQGREIELNAIYTIGRGKQPNYASKNKFIIAEKFKYYLTFDEARKTGKEFKYKEWEEFYTLSENFKYLSCCSDLKANEMLNEKVWKVEQ